MREDIQKNFILLSKVAKEKKYAQEYLGLLARRGDIGSIRIGKRWYTTWAWFEEFLENSQKKKIESVCEVQIAQPVMIAETVAPLVSLIKEELLNETSEEKIKINVPFVFPEREKVSVSQLAIHIQREENISEAPVSSRLVGGQAADKPAKIAVAVKTKSFEMPVRKNIAGEIKGIRERGEISQIKNFRQEKNHQSLPGIEAKFKNISVAEKNRYAVPYQEIKFKKKEDIFSPDFAGDEKMAAPMLSRFAFAMSFAAILLLVAASGYFVWSGGLLARGQVAGASDERNGGFSGITSGGEYVLTSAGDKMKQSLSISRVMVQAAKEKLTNNRQ